jgi:hypothetical protein
MSNMIRSARVTTDRIERAMRIYESNLVRSIGKGTFVVASESSDKVYYIVNQHGCTCPDSLQRQMLCKHIWACHIGAALTIWRIQMASSKQEIEQIAATYQTTAPAGVLRTIQLEASKAIESLPLFPLGQTLATPGALEALRDNNQDASEYVTRHQRGDWGTMSDEDKQENEFSIDKYLRIFSAYHLRDSTKIWIITEADRSATTVLLPSEY